MCPRKYKVALCGKQNVGKTSIFLRMRDGDQLQWDGENHRTQKADHCELSVTLRNEEGTSETVEFTLWDTVDLERYDSLTRSHYVGSAVFLLVYSTDDLDSLSQVKYYHDECKRHAQGASILLVRNKVDLMENDIDYSVPLEEEKKLANQSLRFRNKTSIKTSASRNQGINSIKKTIAKILLETNRSVPPPTNSPFEEYYGELAQNHDNHQSTDSSNKCC